MAVLRQAPAIEAFGGGGFRVDGVRFEGGLLILNDQAQAWRPDRLADLAPADFDAVFAAGSDVVELVILGLGPSMAPPPRAVREAFEQRRLGLELLVTAEACRLYNLLAQEGRRVAAALLPV
ncbi:MAG: Mth938-like domain-containing protein [Pseudomonadota bacterium]|jgi:uncharacterized protein